MSEILTSKEIRICKLFGALVLSVMLSLAICPPLMSSEYHNFRNLAWQDSLSSPVSCILAEDKGFVWIGTLDGLVRFDGNSVHTYAATANHKYSLPSNNILQAVRDSLENVWVVTSCGAALYRAETDDFISPNFEPAEFARTVRSACVVPGGVLFGAQNRIYKYDYATSQIRLYARFRTGLTPCFIIEALAPLYDGTILCLSSRNGILVVIPSGEVPGANCFVILGKSDGVGQNEYKQKARLRAVDGDVFMGGVEGLLRIDKDFEICRQEDFDTVITDVNVSCITADGRWLPWKGLMTLHIGQALYRRAWFWILCLIAASGMTYIFLKKRNSLAEVGSSQDYVVGEVSLSDGASSCGSLSPDEAFIRKLDRIIEDNIENTNLDVSYLCKEMYMSRTVMYNKLKVIKGDSIKDYINKIRMEKALELVRDTKLPFSEISEKTGFSTSRYFSTVFKNYTGRTPSEYRSAQEEKKIQMI